MLRTNSQLRVIGSKTNSRVIPGNPVQKAALAVKSSAETAAVLSPFSGAGVNNNVSLNVLPQGSVLYDTMLSGLIGDAEKSNLRFYRDIYAYDTVAGSAVDLMATMPFSPFHLDGCSDRKRTDAYTAAIEALNFKTLLPEVAIDHMAMGSCTMTPIYKANEKRFVDLISWPAENVNVTPTPFLGLDPLITINPDDVLKAFLTSESSYFRKLRSNMNGEMLDALKSSKIELDPLSTIYVPRKSFTYNHLGTSYYRRILPLYLLEKALYRGTLIEAGRRQRALLHVAIGDDIWMPTSEEIQAIVGLFQQADFDPLGAIVGTKSGITTQELRCLAENAQVEVEGKGKVAIKSLMPDGFEPNDVPVSFATPGLKVRGTGNEFRAVSSIQYQGRKQVRQYAFSDGSVLAATENHNVLVRKPGSLLCTLCSAGDLQSGHTKYASLTNETEFIPPSSVVVVGNTIMVEELLDIVNTRVLSGTDTVVAMQDNHGRPFMCNPEQNAVYTTLCRTRANTKINIQHMIDNKTQKGLWALLEKILPDANNGVFWVLKNNMTFAKFTGVTGAPWVCDTYDLTMASTHEPFFLTGGKLLTKNSGGDFWKYTDITDLTLPMKMRGLGISESFLSQDSSFAAMDVSLSVFTENLRNYRTQMQQRIFYGKIFPLIAYVNEFFTEKLTDKQHRRLTETSALGEVKIKHDLNDGTMLDMPVIHWEKALRPEVDQAHLETLATLKQNGVPVGLATWAAAGGMSPEDLVKEVAADKEIKDKIKAITGKDVDAGDEEFARVVAMVNRNKPKGVLNRGEFPHEYVTETRTGKKKAVYNQIAARDKAYDALAKKVLERKDNPNIHNAMVKDLQARGGIPDLMGSSAGPTL